ncbi:hypothetical protein KUCAC02_031097 [Chaenocephalus aceratus]|uniref:Uncharacterized protein n=1 Tax=Chaenocephalus aceratus TaxID=36190 RepID=A0ACB9XKR8_CHAAC|nr:hypothetical protein KUCAC02_031097 [Chaenocephalus aceratus]
MCAAAYSRRTNSCLPSSCAHSHHDEYNKIDMAEWRYLLSGGMPAQELTNPAVSWLSERAWKDILGLSALDNFRNLAESFPETSAGDPLPGQWDTELDSFQKLLGAALSEGRPSCSRPAGLCLGSAGTTLHRASDVRPTPAADLYKFADVMQFSKKMSAISLGQGQGPWAEKLMLAAMERGHWVFFQNCHLAPSWMPSLERLIENISPVKVHKDFRMWLTSLPSNKFPVSILQNGSKMTIEPPKGIKANLQKTYLRLTNEFFTSSSKVKMFLDEYQDVPYKVLKYTAGEINYGGRVTDDWDRRCLLSVLEDFYCPAVLEDGHFYSPSGVYRQIDTDLDIKGYLAYIRGLPINDTPEIFGLHDNANISFAQNESFALLGALVRLQPRASSAGGKSLEEVPYSGGDRGRHRGKDSSPFNIQDVTEMFPVLYEESMNTVLIQEVIRYNNLLAVISQSLGDIVKALKGLVVMSSELELMASSLFINVVPDMWKAKAYPSLKPLASWVSDLIQRINFLQKWICDGIPPVFWISGFFFPQAFLTGTLQNYARRSGISIDTIGFDFEVIEKLASEITEKPDTGCYIHGLFVEGARWDSEAGQITECRPKELYTEMVLIRLIPEPNRKAPTSGVYICPIYKTLTRAGTLSTTGHSTNYVMAVEVPTDQSQRHWIKRGVALICALDY